jgi:maltoporin
MLTWLHQRPEMPGLVPLGENMTRLVSKICLFPTGAALLFVSFSQPQFALANEGFEFGGYWRVGYNTASAVTAQELVTRKLSWKDFVDTLQGLTGEASDSQDLPGMKTTRHSRSPTYFQLRMGQRFSNGVDAKLKLDSFGPFFHELADTSAEAAVKNSVNLRVRDLYLSIPLSVENTRIWAGSRMLEYEDLRIFDGGNPFDLNAYGVGIEGPRYEAVLSYNKASRTAIVTGATGQPVTGTQQNSAVNTKDVTLLARMELAPWRSFQIKPMLKFTNHAGAPADTVSAIRRKEIEGSAEATLGAVISRTGRPGYWGNTVVAIRETPSGLIGRTDQNEAVGDENSKIIAKQTNAENAAARNSALRGDSPHYDTTFILTDTANIDFNRWSLMTGLWVEHEIYNSPRQLWKLKGSTIVQDDNNKTKKNTRLSFGIQPVYYISDQVHAAFDVNYAMRTKRLSNTDANGIIMTPILRYAMNKSALGTPQIYTSFSYGRYDAETKRQPNGSFKTTLVTTQTGFEIWF